MARDRIRRKRRAAGQREGDHFSIEQVGKALTASMGHISSASRRLKCSYRCLANYIERYEELDQLLIDIREGHIDTAESKLLSKIKAGNLDATKFYLKNIGKGRGYTERTEVTGALGKPFSVTIAPAPGVTKDDIEGKSK